MKKTLLYFLIFAAFSCSKNNIESPQSIDFQDERTSIVLGSKLENPYSVTNMRLALKNLRSKSNGRTSEDDVEIEATHYYVRFNVTDESDIGLLEADSLFLYEYPLDYELSEGDYYAEKSENGYWMYTSVPVAYNFSNIEYEILEDLFLPEEIESNGKTSGFLDELENEALKLTGNYEENEDEKNNTNARRRRINPTGFIRVWDNRINRLEPVRGIIVQT